MSGQKITLNSMHPVLKKWLNWAGGGAGLAGVVFILVRLHQYSGQLDFGRFGVSSWLIVGTLAFIYGSANYLLSIAWWYILGFLRVEVSRNWAVKIYGISQLAKYVPGNIFQFAGRQALGLAADVPGWVLAKSVFWELALISVAGAIFACLTVPGVLPGLSVNIAGFVFLAIVFLTGLFIRRFWGASAVKAFVSHVLFLTVSGLVFVGTLVVVADKGHITVQLAILYGGAYIVAWLAGLLTPGAPAGVGVREIVLLFLLGTVVGRADLLLAIVLNRVITVSGDGGFFVWASMKARKKAA